jgi:hypothetical protein
MNPGMTSVCNIMQYNAISQIFAKCNDLTGQCRYNIGSSNAITK